MKLASKLISLRNTSFRTFNSLLALVYSLQSKVDTVAHDAICNELARALNKAYAEKVAAAAALTAARVALLEAESAYATLIDEVDYTIDREGLHYV